MWGPHLGEFEYIVIVCIASGAANGEAKVWNFSSGACITTLKPPPGSRQEVTAVMAVRGALIRSFLVAGWDRKVGMVGSGGHQLGLIVS